MKQIPLTMAQEGEKVKIISVEGCGRHGKHSHEKHTHIRHMVEKFSEKKKFKNRLCDLGIYEGATVKVLKNDGSGPIILKVLDSKILLGKGQAQKVQVEIMS